MRFILSLLIAGTFLQSAQSADIKYPVSDIPDSLRKNAHAVIRLDESRVLIKGMSTVVQRFHTVVTILNEHGDSYGVLTANYDKLSKVSGIEGILYDASGKVLNKLKAKDVKDISAVSDMNLDDDSRVKVHRFYHNSYPFTVEYSYEIVTGHTFFLPSWIPQAAENIAVQQSIFEIDYPHDFGIRYRAFNTAVPEKTEIKDRIALKWKLENKACFSPPPFSSWRDFQTAVFFAPNDFQLDQKKGNMESWKSFGLFNYGLIAGKDELPPQIGTTVQQMVSGITDPGEKISVLYKYLQENTRYISIQLGIGGWEPYDAKYVAKNGYGDCKALTNYMRALLKEAGITSYYTLVNAGESNFARNRVMEDFPSLQFNHVILCVPINGDTMWLECTNQTLPAGYVGGFTANRKALMITEDGGYLVSTPKYTNGQNRQMRITTVKVSADGHADIQTNTRYSGLKQDDLFGMVKSISPEKIKKILSVAISLSTYELNDFNYSPRPSLLPELVENLDISAENFATVTGKRLFILPNIFSRFAGQIDAKEDRTLRFNFENSYQDVDSTELFLPNGYILEAAIRPVSVTTPFGKYEMSCVLKDNKLIYTRNFEQYAVRMEAADQEMIVNFYQQIYKADRSRVVLVKEDH